MTRDYHYSGTINHYTERKLPGLPRSIDLFDPVYLPNRSGKFMLLMVDNNSRYNMVDTLTNKESKAATDAVDKNFRFIKTQFGRTVKECIMDKGSEFTNQSFKNFLEDNGTQYTHRHKITPEISEPKRKIRTTLNNAIVLLLQSGLSLKVSPYVAKLAADVRNCTYNKQVKDVPRNVISSNIILIMLPSFYAIWGTSHYV